jgi:diguanylate cyclase (GGDEF)-like protein/PAS domain S-box-containing protein
VNPSGPDRDDLTTDVSSSAHVTEHAAGVPSYPNDSWLRTVLENTSDVICVLAADGTFRYISPAAEWVLGYLPEDLVGTVGFDYVHADDAASVAEAFAQIMETPGVHTPVEFRVWHADGSLRHVQAVPNNQLDDPLLRGVVVTFRDLTDRVRAEEKLREAEKRYRTLVEQIPAVTYIQEPIESSHPKAVTYVSPQYETMLGYPPESAVLDEEHWHRRVQPEDRERVLAEEVRADETGEPFEVEYRMIARDGRVVWVRDQAMLVRDEEDRPLYWQGVQFDITERKEIEAALLESEERFRYMVQNSSDVITLVAADGTIRYVSPAIERVLGYSREERVGGNALDLVHPDDVARARRLFAEGRSNPGVPLSIEIRMRHKDGSWRYVEVTGTNLLEDPSAGTVVLNSRDVTERKTLEAQLQHQAFHDALTGLPNRALFSDRLQHAVSRTQRRGGELAVLFMDLDNFKLINDSLGHKAGDELLVGVAERLRTSLRAEDTAARLGGDEFAVLLEDLAHVGEATRVAERIAHKLRAPFTLGERETFVTASIGVAIGDGTIERADELLRDADVAMYHAKHSGKARYAVFEEAMSARVLERLELGNDIRRALEREEFAVHYQPKLSLTTGQIVGFEALVRWEHPERGHMLPGRFMPLAEETGLIVPIGRWVLREACRQTKEWQRRFPSEPPLVVCVNLSARQLRDPDLYQSVVHILEEAGLDPSSLELEITESTAMADAPTTAMAVLEELKALGMRVIMDDFGTGYSTLSWLGRFPVDYVKVDRSIIGRLEEESGARVLIQGMIDLAHALGLEVIAEGVETAGQLARLRAMRCDQGQGHFFSEPLPGEAAGTLLENHLLR